MEKRIRIYFLSMQVLFCSCACCTYACLKVHSPTSTAKYREKLCVCMYICIYTYTSSSNLSACCPEACTTDQMRRNLREKHARFGRFSVKNRGKNNCVCIYVKYCLLLLSIQRMGFCSFFSRLLVHIFFVFLSHVLQQL